MLFVQEESDCQVTDLFFRVLPSRYQVDGFEVAEIDVPAKDVDVQELHLLVSLEALGSRAKYFADVFLLLVAIELGI